MSATVDRLAEMEGQTRPLPWPTEVFYEGLSPDQFAFIVGLSQAWPLLRDEIARLEASVLSISSENAQLHGEHRRVVAGSTALGQQLADLTARAQRDKAEAATALASMTRERDALLKTVHKLPDRAAAADRVCHSFTTTKSGSGGAHGFIDGAALDEWRATLDG